MRKKKQEPLPDYIASEDEIKYWQYCCSKDIRISPIGINGEPNKWKIGISVGDHKKVHYAPSIYDRDTIWVSVYEFMKYYYNKK
jgi:hypothetical protein